MACFYHNISIVSIMKFVNFYKIHAIVDKNSIIIQEFKKYKQLITFIIFSNYS